MTSPDWEGKWRGINIATGLAVDVRSHAHEIGPADCLRVRASSIWQLGQQDVDEFIKKLVAEGDPIKKVAGLGKKSLSAMGGAKALLGAPEGVDANNFDGQRSFTGLGE